MDAGVEQRIHPPDRHPVARVEVLAGVGHPPMMEDGETTGTLLLEFVGTVGHSGRNLGARNEEGNS
jgi:hypothetical protein